MPGRFAIPPAQLVYSLPLSASFFSREETHELQTDSTVIVAVEPPTQGRPSDYGGAVGNLRVAAKLDTIAIARRRPAAAHRARVGIGQREAVSAAVGRRVRGARS